MDPSNSHSGSSSSSSEDEDYPTVGTTRRRRRASYSVPKKSALRTRRLTPSQRRSGDEGAPLLPDTAARSRDMSPVMEQLGHYLEDADEMLEEALERLLHNVQTKAERAKERSSRMVHHAQEAVQKRVEAVQTGVHHAQEAVQKRVQTGVHHAQEAVLHAQDAVHTKVQQAEEMALKMWALCSFDKLPAWMRDNEHLHFSHRPELRSYQECFRSIFRIHTETGNIWTHLLGFILFTVMAVVFYVRPLCATCQLDIALSEKLIFLCFFVSAIVCLACSTLFHTMCAHSEWVSAVFSRLDYAGIAVLIVGSIIPWLYYGFYCQFYAKLTYMISIMLLGTLTVVLSLWDRFNLSEFRVYRALTFLSLGGVAVVPVVHHIIQNGFHNSVLEAQMHWTITMGLLYVTGAVLYATRIPERFLPGKCDIWFQSHQLFHVLVILGAFVHYHGISEMAMYRLKHKTSCLEPPADVAAAAAAAASTMVSPSPSAADELLNSIIF